VDDLMAVSGRALRTAWSLRWSRSVLVLVAVLAAAVTSSAQDAARPNQLAEVKPTPLVLEKYVAPVYPPIAASASVQGIVIIEGTVGAAGQPGDVRVLRSIPLLDNAALDAVRQWRFAASGSGTRFSAVVNFTFSNTPSADEAPATSVGWPPADFALYYGFECFGPGGQGVQTSRSVSANDAFARIPPVELTLEERQRLSLLLVQEGFFNIPGAATERERRESVRVADGRIEVTVTAMAPHRHVTAVAMNSQPGTKRRPADQPEFHHALMVRAYGTWRTVEWTEPVADDDERNAEASRVGTAVRAFFRSLAEKGEPETAECR
jgi:TonB family protein